MPTHSTLGTKVYLVGPGEIAEIVKWAKQRLSPLQGNAHNRQRECRIAPTRSCGHPR